MRMTKEEYCEWLKDNGNKEEKKACDVVNLILEKHLEERGYTVGYDVYFEPHKLVTFEDKRLEYDLIIYLVHKDGNSVYDRKISVEFKEWDMRKVVYQAIKRSWYVDYSYIATRDIAPPPEVLIEMIYMGIGWVVWGENFAFMPLHAYMRYGDRLGNIISDLVRLKLEALIDQEVSDSLRKKKKIKTLNDFGIDGEKENAVD